MPSRIGCPASVNCPSTIFLSRCSVEVVAFKVATLVFLSINPTPQRRGVTPNSPSSLKNASIVFARSSELCIANARARIRSMAASISKSLFCVSTAFLLSSNSSMVSSRSIAVVRLTFSVRSSLNSAIVKSLSAFLIALIRTSFSSALILSLS